MKRLSDAQIRERRLAREMLRKRAIGMRNEGVRIVDVCKELHISSHQLKRWCEERQLANLTPPPTARGYLWLREWTS